MFDLASALNGAVSASLQQIAVEKPSRTPKPGPDAILERLRLAHTLHVGGNPFSVGDIVTPRPDSNLRGAGEPCIVIEELDRDPVLIRSASVDPKETTSHVYGRRLDIRVAQYTDGSCVGFLQESQDYEAWTPEHEAAWRAKLAEKAAGPQPLTLPEIIDQLRDRAAGREVKADWKKGDLVELANIDESKVEPPMEADGVRVGLVREVDPSDGTTNVLYHSKASGKIGGAWFRNRDLRRYGPRPADAAALPAPAEPVPAL